MFDPGKPDIRGTINLEWKEGDGERTKILRAPSGRRQGVPELRGSEDGIMEVLVAYDLIFYS